MRKQIWAMCAVGGAVGSAVVLTLLFSEDSPSTATHVGEAILVVVGALSTIAATGLFFLAFQEVPRLRIAEPVVEASQNPAHDIANAPLERTRATISPRSFVAAPSGSDGAQHSLDVAQLQVSNVPKRGSSRARGVYVRLNFHDSTTGASVQSVWARWSDAPSGDVPGSHHQFAPQTDIPGNGVGVRFDVAAKFHDDEQCHAVDQDSETAAWSALALGPHCVVNVIARGANAKADSAWYEVIHGGPGGTVRLAATNRPSW